MEITLKYDRGVKAEDIVKLEIDEKEFETMIEFDYQERLLLQKEGEKVHRRTGQEILDEMNQVEFRSHRNHYRHTEEVSRADEFDEPIDFFETVRDDEDILNHIENESKDDLRMKINQTLKPDYAQMVIAIYIEGMRISDYADSKGEHIKNISKKLQRAKRELKSSFQIIK
jgi:DNA-directed RNA polymerase specialized sigma24 family protein